MWKGEELLRDYTFSFHFLHCSFSFVSFFFSLSLSPFLFVLHEIVEGSVRIYLFNAQEPEEHLKHA